MKSVTLSIGVPTYNRGARLSVLLTSISAQSLPGDDLFVSDDASTDGSQDLVAKVAGIRLVRQPANVGMVRNWNCCLEQARCDWICLIHDDDTLAPEGLAALRRACQIANGPALIVPTTRQTECDENFRYCFWSPGGWGVLNCPTIPSGAVIHRKIVEELGVFNTRFTYSPDLEYFPRIAAKFPTIIIDSPLTVQYQLHGSNFQVRTWKMPDFVAQLEEIERLIVSYAGVEGEAAEALVKERVVSNLQYILSEGRRRADAELVERYGKLLGKMGAAGGRTFSMKVMGKLGLSRK